MSRPPAGSWSCRRPMAGTGPVRSGEGVEQRRRLRPVRSSRIASSSRAAALDRAQAMSAALAFVTALLAMVRATDQRCWSHRRYGWHPSGRTASRRSLALPAGATAGSGHVARRDGEKRLHLRRRQAIGAAAPPVLFPRIVLYGSAILKPSRPRHRWSAFAPEPETVMSPSPSVTPPPDAAAHRSHSRHQPT